MLMTSAIETTYWAKPIPLREFDWLATREGWEPGLPIGHGATEQDAIEHLIMNEGDEDEQLYQESADDDPEPEDMTDDDWEEWLEVVGK